VSTLADTLAPSGDTPVGFDAAAQPVQADRVRL
jgi:hypothetical protein